ncbi:Ig-like domain-containing protein [Anaerocolumna chitinilytica]|uniref:BIG2 domain-containing protein n=1 Tax=Anaerocolumna chitinilytica TaxID=1727145 RepID=A0A7I8DUB4_9FIRM|nr:Ig-like domain-containing protein [Anaerocolumna chitinilytica]BCK00832.1 hypothetical protein bsdcttw_38720 [Anaerocolumna chitinilytica]
MKKNFFKKKLASALALALVVASVSPVSASAATAAKIVDKGTSTATAVLYVDKVSYGKSAVNFDLSKTYAGTTYTWTVSDSKKATIGAKTGYVVAKAPGVVKVTVTAKKGKTTTKFTQSVTIRKRATAVAAGDDFTLNAGETKSLKATLTPSTSTDAVKYVSDKEAVATVDAKTGVVTAVGAGEATITVYAKATSSAPDTSKWNVTDTVKVKVALGVKEAKQTASNKMLLTFNGNAKDAVKATDFAIESTTTHQVQAVKGLTFSEDGTTATLETYLNFADATEYVLTFAKKEIKFVASVGAVDKIAIKTTTVAPGKETAVEYTVLDKNGIDITNTVDASRISYAFETTNGYAVAGTNKITLFNAGDTATVTITYHTYKYENGAEVTVFAKGVVTAVDPAAVTIGNYEKYTIAASAPSDWTKVTADTKVAIGDNKKIFLRVKDSTNNYIAQSNITYTSSNKDVLLVDTDGTLYPVKEGTVYIIATTGKSSWTLPVTVVAARKASTIAVDKPTATVSNTLNVVDKATFTVTVKDQYGDSFNSNVSDAKVIPLTVVSGPAVTFSGDKVYVTAQHATKGSYSVLITAQGLSLTVGTTVIEPSGAAAVSQLLLSTNKIDNVIKDGTSLADKNVEVKIGQFSGGVLDGYATPSSVSIYDTNNTLYTATISGGSYVFNTAYVSGGAIEKVAKGTYKVVAVYGGATFTSFFTVDDTQVAPSLAINTLSVSTLDLAGVAAAVTIKDANGNPVVIESGHYTVVGNSINVKDIVVKETVTAGTVIRVVVPVDRTFSK